MRQWQPEPHEPVLLEWFAPLLALSRRAREQEIPWPVHLDDFRLLGRFERRPRPDVWMYAHVENGALLMCDADGNAYKYIESSTGKSRGQFREADLRRTFWWSGLTDVIRPVWYDRPAPRYEPEDWYDADADEAGADAGAGEVRAAAAHPTRRRGRSHLRLVVDNRDSA
jgi:hypothetical protein